MLGLVGSSAYGAGPVYLLVSLHEAHFSSRNFWFLDNFVPLFFCIGSDMFDIEFYIHIAYETIILLYQKLFIQWHPIRFGITKGDKDMATDVEAQLKQLDVEMKKAKTQAEKDAIKERQDELKRQLAGSQKK